MVSGQGPVVTRFWGKLGRDRKATGYHPLICHMIDVAAVAEAMWGEVLSEPARKAIAAGLGLGEDIEAAGRWVSFLAGLHDLGKACPVFQLRAGAERLASLYTSDLPGLPPTLNRPIDAPHGVVTAADLSRLLVDRFGLEFDVACTLAAVAGGHHGYIPSPGVWTGLTSGATGRAKWQRQREALFDALAVRWPLPRGQRPTATSHAAAMTVAGLISVADWIGSDDSIFAYQIQDPANLVFDLNAYPGRARGLAEQALRTHHWSRWQQPGAEDARTFAELFPFSPRPLQEASIELAETVRPPAIAVIEAPMGEGKTEAALYLADRWGVWPGPRGAYIALPTRATSDQMFRRVVAFLGRRFAGQEVNVQLLHGWAALSAEVQLLRRAAERTAAEAGQGPATGDQVWDEEARGGPEAAGWFSGSKRGILAPFGVGTVDQALRAALQAKHVFVRLFGLAHRVVVIDEVHAYDVYMSTLLERLLHWLGALGSPVVLLSATLPAARRDGLIAAYQRGAGLPAGAPPAQPYPRITYASKEGTGARHIAAAKRSERTIRLTWVNGELPGEGSVFALGEHLAERLKDGGCAAVVCNTVARAQAVYQALLPFFPGQAGDDGPLLDLLHARFLFKARSEREERALRRFGPGDASRPAKAVLVATQVIEQSLDVDFDLLVTDMAPADLILQRAGRLHRHDRAARPAAVAGPEVWICRPPLANDAPTFGPGDTAVYGGYTLLRSWLALRGQEAVTLPGQIEDLVEAVYREQPCPPEEPAAIQERWQQARARHEQEQQRARAKATDRWLNGPDYAIDVWDLSRFPRPDDAAGFFEEGMALTRDAGPSVTAVFLYDHGGMLSFDVAGRERAPTGRPTLEQTRRLLEHAVPLSNRGIVNTLLDEPTPSHWLAAGPLKSARLVRLDASGTAIINKRTVRLDDTLGVVIESAQTF